MPLPFASWMAPWMAAVLAATLAGASPAVLAQPAPWPQEETERMARITELAGRVHLQRDTGETLELGDASRSRPVAVREGDQLHTGWNSRLVVAVGPNRLKLDERTALRVLRLDREAVLLQVDRGSVVLALRHGESAWRWQVETALGRHQPHGAGLFRIDAPDRRGPESGGATAWRSALRIENEDGTLLLPPGRHAERDRSGQWQIGYPQSDSFSGWAMAEGDRGEPPEDFGEPERRRPRHWQSGPAWEIVTTPPPPPPPPRVIVVPAPMPMPMPMPQPNPMPEPRREWRQPREVAPPVAAPQPPMQQPMQPPTQPFPPRPDRRAHEPAQQQPQQQQQQPPMPAAPAASAPGEPRRSQRAL